MPEAMPEAVNIWNENSLAVQRTILAYENEGLHKWNNNRVSKLAHDLNCTIWALCAWAGALVTTHDTVHDYVRIRLDKNMVKKAWRENRWPMYLTINFDRIEHGVQFKKTGNPTHLLGKADRIVGKVLNSYG